jgi:nucleolar protein 56
MDTVLSQMEIDAPSAEVDKDVEMDDDAAPQTVQKQEKQKKEKKKKEKKSKSNGVDNALEPKKRKHVEANGDVANEGKKKKKKSTSE